MTTATLSGTPTPTFPVHQHLPSGFQYADALQIAAFNATGSVHGASKVALVEGEQGVELAIRMRPPRTWDDIVSEDPKQAYGAHRTLTRAQRDAARDWYTDQYNRGWAAAGRDDKREWISGKSSAAFDDGYSDRANGRIKWHMTYCPDHDNCGG